MPRPLHVPEVTLPSRTPSPRQPLRSVADALAPEAREGARRSCSWPARLASKAMLPRGGEQPSVCASVPVGAEASATGPHPVRHAGVAGARSRWGPPLRVVRGVTHWVRDRRPFRPQSLDGAGLCLLWLGRLSPAGGSARCLGCRGDHAAQQCRSPGPCTPSRGRVLPCCPAPPFDFGGRRVSAGPPAQGLRQ